MGKSFDKRGTLDEIHPMGVTTLDTEPVTRTDRNRFDLSNLTDAGIKVVGAYVEDGKLVLDTETVGPVVPMFNSLAMEQLEKQVGEEMAGAILDKAYSVIQRATLLALLGK